MNVAFMSIRSLSFGILCFIFKVFSTSTCSDPVAAYQQYEQGRAIILETMERELQPLIVSYESLMTLRGPYLKPIYHRLGIPSFYIPKFYNGNTKYVSTNSQHSRVEKILLEGDTPSEHKAAIARNWFRPVNPLTLRDKNSTSKSAAVEPERSAIGMQGQQSIVILPKQRPFTRNRASEASRAKQFQQSLKRNGQTNSGNGPIARKLR